MSRRSNYDYVRMGFFGAFGVKLFRIVFGIVGRFGKGIFSIYCLLFFGFWYTAYSNGRMNEMRADWFAAHHIDVLTKYRTKEAIEASDKKFRDIHIAQKCFHLDEGL